jgi:hypothetical protein
VIGGKEVEEDKKLKTYLKESWVTKKPSVNEKNLSALFHEKKKYFFMCVRVEKTNEFFLSSHSPV